MKINKFINPFNVTKATEFTDQQINEYWVDFDAASLLNLNDYTPKYLIGGKGCGKTHILRYFSYANQKIRHNKDVISMLREDEYIGIYYLLNGLDTSRFTSKGIEDTVWHNLYKYYFELYVSEHLIDTLIDIFENINIENKLEFYFVESILDIFLQDIKNRVSDFKLSELRGLLSNLRKSIDLEILNAAYTKSISMENVKTLFSPGDLIFGIPKLMTQIFDIFKSIKVVYIFDEFEKLFEWQKKFINTVVWEKKLPATVWVGSRRYGFTTTETTTGEKIKNNSEFQLIDLDLAYRADDQKYQKFASALCNNRLEKVVPSVVGFLDQKLPSFDDEAIYAILEQKEKLRHIEDFKKNISSKLNENFLNTALDLLKESVRNPLDEKCKLRLFYQAVAKKNTQKDYISILREINTDFFKYLKKDKVSKFKNTVQKYRLDLLTQLLVENKIKNYTYIGFEQYVQISWGNPRILLSILKEIFEIAVHNNEKPFESSAPITADIQYLGLYNTSKWFYEDAEITGEKGLEVYKSIWCLADYLKLYRFSHRMTETSVSSFSYNAGRILNDSANCIELAASHAFFIEIDSKRKQRNTGQSQQIFQLNRILAPLWDLPISRRGTIDLRDDVVNSIFSRECRNKFDQKYIHLKNKYTFPFESLSIKNDSKDASDNSATQDFFPDFI